MLLFFIACHCILIEYTAHLSLAMVERQHISSFILNYAPVPCYIFHINRECD